MMYQSSFDEEALSPMISSSASELTAADEADQKERYHDRMARYHTKKLKAVRQVAVINVSKESSPSSSASSSRSSPSSMKGSSQQQQQPQSDKGITPCREASTKVTSMKSARANAQINGQHIIVGGCKATNPSTKSTGVYPKSVKFYYPEMKLPDRIFPLNNSHFVADVSASIPNNWKKDPEYVAGFFEALVQFSSSTLTTAMTHPQFITSPPCSPTSPSCASTSSSSPSSKSSTKPTKQQSTYFVHISKAFDKSVAYWTRKLDKGNDKDQRKALQQMLLWYANCKRLEILITTSYSTAYSPPPAPPPPSPPISSKQQRPTGPDSDENFPNHQREDQFRNVAMLFNDLSQNGLMKAFRRLRPLKLPI